MNLQAVLFDLDNTLILFEELVFFENYTKKLYLSFKDIMTPPEFTQRLIHSTQMMVENNGEMNNAEFFIRDFANGSKIGEKKLWERFTSFYEHEFEQFKPLMKPLDSTREVISFIRECGLKIVIASNPMFPMNVQQSRLRWAGLDDFHFDLITTAENSNYVKPRLEYYYQICEKINTPTDKCLMAGNDPFNDMIASKTGMKTYLTTDTSHLSVELSRELARSENIEMPVPDFRGPLKELTKVIG